MQSFENAHVDVQVFFSPPALVLLSLLTDDTAFLLQVNDSSSVPLVSFFIFVNSYEYVQVDLRTAEIDRKLEGEFPVLL